MAYATLVQLKAYLGISTIADDALLSEELDRATADIEVYTGRVFVAASATRYITREYLASDGLTLWTDGQFVAITGLLNGDTDQTAIAATEYSTVPRNAGPPYYAIKLHLASTVYWQWATDVDVEVTATWGWSAAALGNIEHACIRLTGYYYRQKDAQVFDVTAQPDAGIITIPQGIPADVKRILKPYRQNVGWI